MQIIAICRIAIVVVIAGSCTSANMIYAQVVDQAKPTPNQRHAVDTKNNNRGAKKNGKAANVPGRAAPRIDVSAGLPIHSPPNVKLRTGTLVYTEPKAEGDRLAIQTEFAQVLSQTDQAPKSRFEHFQWLQTTPYVIENKSTQIGWSGVIVDSQPLLGDGWIIKVHMTPNIHPSTRSPIMDFVEETYHYNNKRYKMIDSDANQIKPNLQGYPIIR